MRRCAKLETLVYTRYRAIRKQIVRDEGRGYSAPFEGLILTQIAFLLVLKRRQQIRARRRSAHRVAGRTRRARDPFRRPIFRQAPCPALLIYPTGPRRAPSQPIRLPSRPSALWAG